jgi:hypothetical protein
MNRRRFGVHFLTIAALLLPVGCGEVAKQAAVETGAMGTQVRVGPLIYTVLETEWKTQLGEGGTGQVPKNRFLTLRLTITNSGGKEIPVPLLQVEGKDGQMHMELSEAKELPQWLGFIRVIRPAQTEEGRIAFDVPPGAYYLHVVDGGETGSEKYARIEIPLQMGTDSVPVPER